MGPERGLPGERGKACLLRVSTRTATMVEHEDDRRAVTAIAREVAPQHA
jgi:hypothetical protein